MSLILWHKINYLYRDKKKVQYIERSITSLDWVTLIFVGCFVLLAITKSLYPKLFEDFIKLPVSSNYFLSNGNEEQIKHPFNLLLLSIQFFSISLFIYLFFNNDNFPNLLLFSQILIGVIVFIVVKISIEKLIGSIFSIEDIINEYTYKKSTYRNLLSLLLLIFNLFFYYSFTPNTQMLLIFFSVLVFLNIIILYSIYKKYSGVLFGNFFYFLLYLCTLEISPYILIYKVLKFVG